MACHSQRWLPFLPTKLHISSTSASPACSMSYSQNIRTHLPTGGYAPYHRPHFGLSSALLSRILTSNMDGKSCGGRSDGLETPAGVYHGDGRSGTAATQ